MENSETSAGEEEEEEDEDLFTSLTTEVLSTLNMTPGVCVWEGRRGSGKGGGGVGVGGGKEEEREEQLMRRWYRSRVFVHTLTHTPSHPHTVSPKQTRLPSISEVKVPPDHPSELGVKRRTKLPYPVVDVGDFSLWSFLRKNIGQKQC